MNLLGPRQACALGFLGRCCAFVGVALALLVSSGTGCYHYVPSKPSDLTPEGLAETRVRVNSGSGRIELEEATYQEPTLSGTVYSIARPTPDFEVRRHVTLLISDIRTVQVRRLNKAATGVLAAGGVLAGSLTVAGLILLGVYWGWTPGVRASGDVPVQAPLPLP